MRRWTRVIDRLLISEMHHWGIPLLRLALGIVFLWFGGLKLAGVSPVVGLIAQTYSFFPQPIFIKILGLWEVIIGFGLILRLGLRLTLVLLWLQLAGTFLAVALAPGMFYSAGNPLLLTLEGEFIAKNLVLIAASLVVGGFEIARRR